ncbi:hypothetical protein VKT23_007693 [Stygiomarasmius scandens]|uniref:Uncharacterized protein n=1 Tax=Marasmiellus scandens TaxID=2682957 RepID=A0ABR1ITN0_9AGAR
MNVPSSMTREQVEEVLSTSALIAAKIQRGEPLSNEDRIWLTTIAVDLTANIFSEHGNYAAPGLSPEEFRQAVQSGSWGNTPFRGMPPYRLAFGSHQEHQFDWLKLVFWDSKVTNSAVCPKVFTFQVSAAGDPPTIPLNIASEGVQIYIPSVIDDWRSLSAEDWHPLTAKILPIAPEGTCIRVDYPLVRGLLEGPRVKRLLKFPLPPLQQGFVYDTIE